MRLAVVATTLVLGFGVGALGACASASEAPAWFEARSAENDAGYPSLREVPRGTDANTDAAHWAVVESEVMTARAALKAAGKTYATRMLTADEIAANDNIKSLVDSTKAAEQDGRWLAFAATEPFPKDTHVEVTIGPGTPSAEGPNTTPDAQRFSFETYPPLAIVRAECGWGECPPGAPFAIEFNNPLAEDRFDAAQVTTTPAIVREQVIAQGNYVTVQGLTAGQTAYTTVVSGGLVDTFGQTLGKDASLDWKTGKAYPNFYGPSGMIVLDPGAKAPTFDVFTTNYDGVKVKLYQVTPGDYDAYGNYLENQWQRHKPSLPGKKVFDQFVRVKRAGGGSIDDQLVETKIDLAPALRNGLGHVIAVVEPSVKVQPARSKDLLVVVLCTSMNSASGKPTSPRVARAGPRPPAGRCALAGRAHHEAGEDGEENGAEPNPVEGLEAVKDEAAEIGAKGTSQRMAGRDEAHGKTHHPQAQMRGDEAGGRRHGRVIDDAE